MSLVGSADCKSDPSIFLMHGRRENPQFPPLVAEFKCFLNTAIFLSNMNNYELKKEYNYQTFVLSLLKNFRFVSFAFNIYELLIRIDEKNKKIKNYDIYLIVLKISKIK